MRKNRKGQIHNEFRLLVLDDDEMITLALRAYFEGCGYTVDIESNPLRAIEKIRLDHYDILLLDFLMNPICGDKVVEEIRKFNTDLFIILLTGHKDLAPPVKTIRELDIQGYYEKSDKFDQLELLVESCVKSIRQMQTIRRYRDVVSGSESTAAGRRDCRPGAFLMSGRRRLRDAQSAEYSRLQRKSVAGFLAVIKRQRRL